MGIPILSGLDACWIGRLLDWMRLASSKSSGLEKRGGFRAQHAGRLLDWMRLASSKSFGHEKRG
ncbi:MAG: hypothetical protein RBR69_07610, partial [Candidatus Cloacimonadaceae bacterium]|nr:hypothetical protein [Candidatus Cloacimonadaceae bacterium]